MGYHGEKSRPKKAVEFWSQWTCVVCRQKVVPGAMVIGICNWNKSAGGNKGWDHVHVACAPHWDVQAPPRGGAPAPAGPSSSSAQDAAGPPPPVADTHNRDFMNRVVAMEFNEHEAQVIINHFNGDTRKAMSAMCEIFAARYDVVEMGEEAGQLEALLEAEQANNSGGEEHVPIPSDLPESVFASHAAKKAGADLFLEFVKPILPKPQTDGSFKDGDPELLNWSLKTPILLVLPRAERMCELLKPPGGWDEDSMAKVRDYFALEAAGNNPGLPQRTPGCPIGPLPPNCPSDPRLPH